MLHVLLPQLDDDGFTEELLDQFLVVVGEYVSEDLKSFISKHFVQLVTCWSAKLVLPS